jgi:hypothetical protein
MKKRRRSPQQLRLPTPPPQLGLPLPDEVPQAAAEAVHWRLCRQCGRPIHPDAPRCGWCPQPVKRSRPEEETASLF